MQVRIGPASCVTDWADSHALHFSPCKGTACQAFVRMAICHPCSVTHALCSPMHTYCAWLLSHACINHACITMHAVEREFRVLDALARAGAVPVARPVLLCEDPSVIGTPFYLMEYAKVGLHVMMQV